MDLWESFCIRVGTYVIEMLPGVIRDGIHQWGLDYPPVTNLDLPGVSDYDMGRQLTGFCEIGICDVGNGIVSLSKLVMKGLDTVSITAGQALSFTQPDITMTIPLTLGELKVAGEFKIDHQCRNKLEGKSCKDSTGPVFTKSGKGTLGATLRNAQLVVTVGGLDQDIGAAGSVTIRWAGDPPELILDTPKVSPDTPAGATRAINNYFLVAKNALTTKLRDRLTELITGDAPILPGGRSLSGELLQIINQAFNAVP